MKDKKFKSKPFSPSFIPFHKNSKGKMSNDDVLPKCQGMESSAPLMLNGHHEHDNVERPCDTAKEPVIICTLQAKPVKSMSLRRSILKGGNSIS